MNWDYFKNNWAPIAIGLVVGIFFVWLDVSSQRAKDKEFQQRMEANGKWIDAKRKADLWTEPPTQAAERKEALQVMQAFVNEVQVGNLVAAYQLTSPSFRAKQTAEAFEEFVRANPVLSRPAECLVFGNVTLSNGAMWSMQMSKVEDANRATSSVNVTVVRDGSVWRVSEFKIEPRTKS